jgi:hypothetical protein
VRLVEHIRGIEPRDGRIQRRIDQLVENQEQLERFDRPRVEVVVAVLAVVEVEPAELSELDQPRDDLFDVDVRRVVAEIDERERAIAERLRAGIARAPVVDDRRVERRLVQLVLEEQPATPRQRLVDRPTALQIPVERAARVHLSREVAAVADPDRVRRGAQLGADREAFDVVFDSLPPHGRVGVREAAELVRQRLPLVILEGVRVRRVDVQAARRGIPPQFGRRVGSVPRNVQRDGRRHADEAVDDGAVVDLLVDRLRLATAGKAPEAGAAGRERPRRQRDAERHGGPRDRLDVDAAPSELRPEVRVVVFERGGPGVVVRFDTVWFQHGG